MKKNRYTEEQIVGILKESEAGLKTSELCRKQWHQPADILPLEGQVWRALEVSEAQRLRQLEDRTRS
jgi:putative transposase